MTTLEDPHKISSIQPYKEVTVKIERNSEEQKINISVPLKFRILLTFQLFIACGGRIMQLSGCVV